MANYLTFSSPNSFTLKTNNASKNWDGTLECSTDASIWNTWDGATTLSADSGKLYLRGTGNTIITGEYGAGWLLSGSDIACEGNIENLLDYATVANGKHPTMAERCYYYMFSGCTSLTSAPALPATTLTDNCYYYMFSGCTSLTSAPALPATSLVRSCYSNMFYGCKSLTSAPALPATTLTDYCYYNMFSGCTSLTSAPALPATTLTYYCYNSMFKGCTSLTSAPALPATTLADYCYNRMFYGCKSLTSIPALPATTLTDHCYYNMFQNCTMVKISTTKTSEYSKEYRIPTNGTGTTATDACYYMFINTGGTFKSTPSINTTYYTSNEVIYEEPEEATPTTITYNGNEIASLEAGQTAIFPEGKKATGDVSIVFGSNGSITYKGVTTEVEKGKTAHLLVSGKKFATDVVINTKQ